MKLILIDHKNKEFSTQYQDKIPSDYLTIAEGKLFLICWFLIIEIHQWPRVLLNILHSRTIDIQTSIVCQVSIRGISISIQTNRKSFWLIYRNTLIVISSMRTLNCG